MGSSSRAGEMLEQAWAAFSRADWGIARDLFQEALDTDPSPEALDGLAQAFWWLGDTETATDLRTRAFAAYERCGACADAANIAVHLGGEYRIAGNASLASGWLGRAARLLEGAGDCVARGWMHVEMSKRAGAPEQAEQHARDAVELARRIGHAGLESCALSHLGLARVSQGDTEGGRLVLDEAMAIALSVAAQDPLAIGDACCTTLVACQRLADPLRVRDWSRSLSDFVRRRNYIPLASWCRAVYAGFLVATGEWDQAERELRGSLQDASRLTHDHRTTALAHLADLRVRQGRLEEAEQLLAGIEDRPVALAPVVKLDCARDVGALARERIERRLENAGENIATAAPLIALPALAELASSDPSSAARSAATLATVADRAGRADLVATAAVIAARAASLTHEQPDAASLEAALETFLELHMPLEEGEARLELARAYSHARPGLAIEQARAALGIFERLGAARHGDAAAKLLRDLGAPGRAAPRASSELTRREQQVLELVAAGHSNAEIAQQLVISPRTAEHHVARILTKLGLRNRAEAAAYNVRKNLSSQP